jgi:hypothetical protein
MLELQTTHGGYVCAHMLLQLLLLLSTWDDPAPAGCSLHLLTTVGNTACKRCCCYHPHEAQHHNNTQLLILWLLQPTAAHANCCCTPLLPTCAQPRAMRKPVMTSSKHSTAPSAVHMSRRPCSKQQKQQQKHSGVGTRQHARSQVD